MAPCLYVSILWYPHGIVIKKRYCNTGDLPYCTDEEEEEEKNDLLKMILDLDARQCLAACEADHRVTSHSTHLLYNLSISLP